MSLSSRPQPRRGPSGAWSRLKPAVSDPLDVYGLPSKGETRLNDPKLQEQFYTKIVDRYMKFCSVSSKDLSSAFSSLSLKPEGTGTKLNLTGGNQPPQLSQSRTTTSSSTSTTSTSSGDSVTPSDLPQILLAMRKLREGINSSRRTDAFAQRAYIFIIHATILTQTWEAYTPALLYLLHNIHPHTPLPPTVLQEFAGYRVLDLACRTNDLLEAHSVRREFGVRDRKVVAVLKALVQDDWVRFWRVRNAVDGYQRAVMEFAVERMRLHALKCLGRTYLTLERGFVERSAGGARWEELVKGGVGWELVEGTDKVVIRKTKGK